MGKAHSTCLGCDSNRRRTSILDEPLKGHKYQAPTIPKSNSSDKFWTTRTMDNNAFRSRGSNSLINTSNKIPDVGASGNGDVNHGLLLWNQTRQQWLAKKKPENRENREKQLRGPRLSAFSAFFGIIFSHFTISGWNATYESLLGSNRPFTKPIPLAEMVDFLVDIWEQEGMYD